MPVEGVKLKNEFKLPEAAAAAHKSVAPHSESTLKSAGSKSDDSFDCLACVKYYASAVLDGICSICAFIYNLLFGNKAVPEKKAEEET